jgi:transcriptional regulator of met regulon
MDTKTHWKKLINPDYIGAYALQPDEDLVVTIDYVQREQVTGTGGKKEECTVAHLVGQKPLILNVTNSKSIAKLYGSYIEDWSGKQITLYASMTKLAGDMVECLRIRPSVPTKRRKPITDDRLEAAIKSIKAGEYTTERLRSQFELTDEQNEKVNEAVKAAVEE